MSIRPNAPQSPDDAISARIPAAPGRFGVQAAMRVLMRRKWFVLGPLLLALGIGAAVLSQLTPEYGATASIVVEAGPPRSGGAPAVPGTAPEPSARIVSEADLLQSANLLGQVVDKLGLAEDPEFGAAPPAAWLRYWTGAKEYVLRAVGWDDASADDRRDSISPKAKALSLLMEAVSVSTRPPSTVISVSARSIDRKKAERIANTIASTYVSDKARIKTDATRQAVDYFQARLPELKREAEIAERTLAEFRAKSGYAVGEGKTTAAQTLAELNSQLNQARMQTAERESRLKALQRAQSEPAAGGGLAESLGSPVISALRLQEAEAARRVTDLSLRYGDSYPRLPEARAELAQIQKRIALEIAKIATAIQGDLDAARSKEAQLKEQVDQFEKQASEQGQSEDEFRRLRRQAEIKRAAYQDMLKRSSDLQEQIGTGSAEVRMLAATSTSERPVYPRYVRTMYLSALAGLAIGLVWITVLERLDSGFRTGEQVERLTGRTLIGMVPMLPRSTTKRSTPVRFVMEKPMSAYSESLRSAQTAVTLGTLDKKAKVIMVTSSIPGEGKSTFSCSLAMLAARSNPAKRILLVDCDLRRASVAELLGVSQTSGTIDEYLRGEKGLDQVLGRVKDSGLYYILSRTNTPNSAELLASADMQAFIEALAGQFDLVILDTPPLMAVSDPRIVARFSDYIMFLVRWEKTERDLATNALKLLGDVPAGVGVVLSQVDVRRHARYGYNDYGASYSKYHDYYVG